LAKGCSIFFDLISSKKGIYQVNSKAFKNPIYLRKGQSDIYIFEQIFIEQQYQFPHPDPNRVRWIIDAGANIGLAAIYFSMKFPNATIISIEPDRENFTMLKKNTSAYKNIHCIEAGLWHKNELIFISNKSEKSAGFVIEAGQTSVEEQLSTVTIPQLLQEHGIKNADIVKLDIEGSEKELFQNNAEEWIDKSDCIIVELHDWIKKGTSTAFFKEMSKYEWTTFVKGENIICLKAN
jgi:FkbM family methyltransferase